MARNYATTPTAIWRPDGAFAGLSVDAQWAHWMLTSQPDISAAGVLSINLRRWTRRAKDASRDRLAQALKELGERNFIVYDHETEELWIRVFVEWDGGYNNRKRQPVIRSAALEVESPSIREALAEELRRLRFPVDGLLDSSSGRASSVADSPSGTPSQAPLEVDTQDARQATHKSSDDGEYSQGNRVSDSPSDGESRSDRVVVTEVEPQPTTHNPPATTPNPPPSSGGAGGDSPKPARGDRGTRLPEAWTPNEQLRAWADEKAIGNARLSALVDIPTETEKFRNYWLAKTGSGSTKLDWGRTYQNWLLEAAQRRAGRPGNGIRASPQNGHTTGQNRHVDDLPPEERDARNPFATAVRSSQVATRRSP